MNNSQSRKDYHIEYNKKWRIKNRQKSNEYAKSWRNRNLEHARALSRLRTAKRRQAKIDAGLLVVLTPEQRKEINKAKLKAWRAEYYIRNKERINKRNKQWRVDNPELQRLNHHRYMASFKARKAGLLHPDLDKQKEMEFFVEIARLNKETGIKHEIDHIIPQCCKGWHHHLNLQILPAKINRIKKANPFWEMDGYKSWRDVPEFLWPIKLIPAYRNLTDAQLPA